VLTFGPFRDPAELERALREGLSKLLGTREAPRVA